MSQHEKKRVRVRSLTKVSLEDRVGVISRQRCLSTPHMGEAIDAASDSYRMRDGWKRELHHLHELGRTDECTDRCLLLDYVPADLEKSQDELDVAGLVTAGRAG